MIADGLRDRATDLIRRLGQCPYSARLYSIVLSDEEHAREMASWLWPHQLTVQEALKPRDNFAEYANETTWSFFLLGLASERERSSILAKRFLSSMPNFEDEIALLDQSAISGISYMSMELASREGERLSTWLARTALPTSNNHLLAEDGNLDREISRFYLADLDGDYPVLWDVWQTTFLLRLREIKIAEKHG
jgi:hypothetical protein